MNQKLDHKDYRIKNLLDLISITPKSIVEIGVWKGDFSSQIVEHFPQSKLHLIDPWKVSLKNHNAWYGIQSINQEIMDEIYIEVKRRFYKFPNVSIFRGGIESFYELNKELIVDLFYVDGDHTYEGVLLDLMYCHKMTNKNSLIILDDYTIGSWWGDGVYRALHTFLGAFADKYLLTRVNKTQVSILRVSK